MFGTCKPEKVAKGASSQQGSWAVGKCENWGVQTAAFPREIKRMPGKTGE